MTKSRIPSLSKAEIAAIADRAEGRDPSPATTAERGERVSIEDLAKLTGYDRGTIREWISYAGGGSATFSPRQARELLHEYNAELERRENPGAGDRGIIRSYAIEPEGYC